jgi:hypothetical protein
MVGFMNRVALEISDTFVKREQDPIGGKGGIHNCWICRTAKSFAGDRVGIAAEAAVPQRGSRQA